MGLKIPERPGFDDWILRNQQAEIEIVVPLALYRLKRGGARTKTP